MRWASAREWSAPRNANSSTPASACQKTLVRWWRPLRRPKSWLSSMCENRVTGNQLAASPEVSAHSRPGGVRPPRTCMLRVTYSGSSKLTKSETRDGSVQRDRGDKKGQRDPWGEMEIARWP